MTTYTKIETDIVIRACESYLDARNKKFEAVKHQIAEKCVARSKFFRKFFFGKPITWDQALLRAEYSEKLRAEKWAGGYWHYCVEELLTMAKMSSDGQVYMSTKDAWILDWADK